MAEGSGSIVTEDDMGQLKSMLNATPDCTIPRGNYLNVDRIPIFSDDRSEMDASATQATKWQFCSKVFKSVLGMRSQPSLCSQIDKLTAVTDSEAQAILSNNKSSTDMRFQSPAKHIFSWMAKSHKLLKVSARDISAQFQELILWHEDVSHIALKDEPTLYYPILYADKQRKSISGQCIVFMTPSNDHVEVKTKSQWMDLFAKAKQFTVYMQAVIVRYNQFSSALSGEINSKTKEIRDTGYEDALLTSEQDAGAIKWSKLLINIMVQFETNFLIMKQWMIDISKFSVQYEGLLTKQILCFQPYLDVYYAEMKRIDPDLFEGDVMNNRIDADRMSTEEALRAIQAQIRRKKGVFREKEREPDSYFIRDTDELGLKQYFPFQVEYAMFLSLLKKSVFLARPGVGKTDIYTLLIRMMQFQRGKSIVVVGKAETVFAHYKSCLTSPAFLGRLNPSGMTKEAAIKRIKAAEDIAGITSELVGDELFQEFIFPSNTNGLQGENPTFKRIGDMMMEIVNNVYIQSLKEIVKKPLDDGSIGSDDRGGSDFHISIPRRKLFEIYGYIKAKKDAEEIKKSFIRADLTGDTLPVIGDAERVHIFNQLTFDEWKKSREGKALEKQVQAEQSSPGEGGSSEANDRPCAADDFALWEEAFKFNGITLLRETTRLTRHPGREDMDITDFLLGLVERRETAVNKRSREEMSSVVIDVPRGRVGEMKAKLAKTDTVAPTGLGTVGSSSDEDDADRTVTVTEEESRDRFRTENDGDIQSMRSQLDRMVTTGSGSGTQTLDSVLMTSWPKMIRIVKLFIEYEENSSEEDRSDGVSESLIIMLGEFETYLARKRTAFDTEYQQVYATFNKTIAIAEEAAGIKAGKEPGKIYDSIHRGSKYTAQYIIDRIKSSQTSQMFLPINAGWLWNDCKFIKEIMNKSVHLILDEFDMVIRQQLGTMEESSFWRRFEGTDTGDVSKQRAHKSTELQAITENDIYCLNKNPKSLTKGTAVANFKDVGLLQKVQLKLEDLLFRSDGPDYTGLTASMNRDLKTKIGRLITFDSKDNKDLELVMPKVGSEKRETVHTSKAKDRFWDIIDKYTKAPSKTNEGGTTAAQGGTSRHGTVPDNRSTLVIIHEKLGSPAFTAAFDLISPVARKEDEILQERDGTVYYKYKGKHYLFRHLHGGRSGRENTGFPIGDFSTGRHSTSTDCFKHPDTEDSLRAFGSIFISGRDIMAMFNRVVFEGKCNGIYFQEQRMSTVEEENIIHDIVVVDESYKESFDFKGFTRLIQVIGSPRLSGDKPSFKQEDYFQARGRICRINSLTAASTGLSGNINHPYFPSQIRACNREVSYFDMIIESGEEDQTKTCEGVLSGYLAEMERLYEEGDDGDAADVLGAAASSVLMEETRAEGRISRQLLSFLHLGSVSKFIY